MSDPIRLGTKGLATLDRMVRHGLVMVRQSADTPMALRGRGYLYSTHPDGRIVPPSVAVLMLDAGVVVSRRDDLFGGVDGGGAGFCACETATGRPSTEAAEA